MPKETHRPLQSLHSARRVEGKSTPYVWEGVGSHSRLEAGHKPALVQALSYDCGCMASTSELAGVQMAQGTGGEDADTTVGTPPDQTPQA